MHIFIKTGLFQHQKYIPHLVEHCCVRDPNMDEKLFFKYYYDTEASVYSTHTEFTIPDYWDVDDFVDYICQPLSSKIINQEKTIIREELSEVTYGQKIFEKTGQKLYGKQFVTTRSQHTKYEDIINFHQQYYKKEHMMICNDHYEIISQKVKLSHSAPSVLSPIHSLDIVLGRENHHIVFCDYKGWKDYFLFAFCEYLLDSFLQYEFSIKHNHYFFDTPELMWFADYVALDTPQMTIEDIDRGFFEAYKKNFMQTIVHNYFQRKIALNSLFLATDIQKTDIIKFVESLDYATIISLLSV